MKNNRQRKQTGRILLLCKFGLQIVFFLIAPGVFSSVFGAVKTVFSCMGAGEPLVWSSAAKAAVCLFLYTWAFGRFFCGNACAFGTLGDIVHKGAALLFRKMKIKPPTLPKKLDKRLIAVKYAVLAAIAVICCRGQQLWLHGKSPWDAFAQLISGDPVFAGYEIGYLLLALLIVGMAWIPRFFCRFLCPLGAVFSLLPPPLLVKLKKPKDANDGFYACGRCQACSRSCPAGLELNQQDEISSGECFRCHSCLGSCPQSKPQLTICGRVFPAAAAILLQGLLLLGLLYALGMTRI